MGERQKITYPDGTKVSWKYDSLLRPIQMNRIAENKEPLWIDYKYNRQGVLIDIFYSFCIVFHFNAVAKSIILVAADRPFSGILMLL